MPNTRRGWTLGITLSMLVFLLPTAVAGQTQVFGLKIDGDVEVGGRFFIDRPTREERSKFEEYRHIPPGPFLERLRLRVFTEDERNVVEIGAWDAGERDQNYLLRAARIGLLSGEFEWDQIPRVYSFTGRTLYDETARGVFELPDPIQATLQGAPAAARPGLLEGFLAGAHRIDLHAQWDIARLALLYTPTPDWDIGAQWTRIRKDGRRPFGVMFGTPGGNLVEVVEPIDHTIHDLRVHVGFARPLWQIQGAYHLSLFQNDVDALVVDNPLRVTDSVAAGPARGRVDLAPNNVAHTVSLTGAVNLPLRSRITSTVAYGMRFQDDAFLPHTINTALAGDPRLVLPRDSLEGDVRTLLGNILFTSRPLPADVSFTARYRYYDFDDRTRPLTFDARVRTDQTLLVETLRTERYNYTKQNAGADVRWRLFSPVVLGAGVGWEQWQRDPHEREVRITDEYTPRVSIDVTPFDWLLLRSSYARSWREGTAYHQVAAAQLPLLRKYDMADRIRDRVDLLAEINPIDTLTFTGTFSLREDDYHRSPYGLQDDRSWAAGLDINWTLTERLSVFAGWVHEEFDTRLRSRSRTAVVDLPQNDWVARNHDTVDTLMVGLGAQLLPRVDLRLAYNVSWALARMRASNPLTPTLPQAVATDFPTIQESLHLLEATLRYRFYQGWSAGFRYAYESFRQKDFRTDNMQPFMGGTDIFLGARTPNYTAHIVSLLIGYRF